MDLCIAAVIAVVIVSSGCIGGVADSASQSTQESIEKTQKQVQKDSTQQVQDCPSLDFEILQYGDQNIGVRNIGTSSMGKLEVEFNIDGQTFTKTVNYPEAGDTKWIDPEQSGKVNSVTVSSTICPSLEKTS